MGCGVLRYGWVCWGKRNNEPKLTLLSYDDRLADKMCTSNPQIRRITTHKCKQNVIYLKCWHDIGCAPQAGSYHQHFKKDKAPS